MRAPRVPVEEQYRLIMECRKSGLSDYQWCLNNDMNKNTDTATMELMIGNMNLHISNETDPLLLAKTIQILAELSCWAHTRRYFVDAVPKGKQYDYSNPAVQFCSKLFDISFRAASM